MNNYTTSMLIKELRARTGAGFLECKRALLEEKGDIELSIDNLRKKGIFKAEKKINNITNYGCIFSEIKNNIGVLLELNCETDFVANSPIFIEFGKKIISEVFLKNLKTLIDINIYFKDEKSKLISQVDENINIRSFFIINGSDLISYIHGKRIGVLLSSSNLPNNMMKNIAMHIAASKPEYLHPEDVSCQIIEREYHVQLELSKKFKKSPSILKKIVDGRMHKFVNSISLLGQNFIMDPTKTVKQVLIQNNAKIISFIRFEIGFKNIISSKNI